MSWTNLAEILPTLELDTRKLPVAHAILNDKVDGLVHLAIDRASRLICIPVGLAINLDELLALLEPLRLALRSPLSFQCSRLLSVPSHLRCSIFRQFINL